jgi:hypothetical protein
MYNILFCYETRKLVLGSLQLISTTLTQVPGCDWLETLPLSGEVGAAIEDLVDGAELELLGDCELLQDNTLESLVSLFESSLVISCAGLEFVVGIFVAVTVS